MKLFLMLCGLLILILGGVYVAAGWHERELTPEERAEHAPGQTVEIENGTIHYLDRGPSDGPVIVMVHGFSTPHFIFEQNAAALIEAGFRVIQFDHFGRGWSDRPRTMYDVAFYDQELLQVLDALNLKDPVGLVGLSMGGVITAEFVANHPERVSKLFLFVSAGLKQVGNPDSFRNKLILAPVIGDWIWRVAARPVLLGDGQYNESKLAPENRLQGDVTEQMNYKGYFPALLSSFRHLPMRDRDETFSRAGLSEVPIMAVFGGADETIDVESAERLKELAPEAKVEVIEDGTHGLNYQMFETVNPMLVDFFEEG